MIQAYNYLVGTYPVKRSMIYPVKNRVELKKVYNEIVSLSNRSPFYKVNISKENQEYVIGVKEAALELKAKILDIHNQLGDCFESKKVSVSDENILSAELLKQDIDNLPENIEIKVKELADVQINNGKELSNASSSVPQGDYHFDAVIMNETYSLTFTQKERLNNQLTLDNMAEFLNKNLPNIHAIVEKGEDKNYSRIKLISERTGRYGERKFSFNDTEEFKIGIVDLLGLNRVEKASAYSEFELNGIYKQTASNSFTLENALFISLHESADDAVNLKITPDSNKILPVVETVISAYNGIIGLANDRLVENEEHYSALKLINEMKSMTEIYYEELSACGIKTMEDGAIALVEALAVQASEDRGMESLFHRENGFITKLMAKAEAIAINPVEYLDKTIVFYPNTSINNFRNPYVTSMYSGLFFNSYC